ncbi:hypothetical protein KP509_34G073400 [Ceratopteris richardii]|uniref:Pentatricopeptide repeat-containing protein n=1 Tax=Ceratopteris richardii TaxID=49495 RepID=A0A8T2QMW7_CERRI|nr:hypothetical protein KP509_34G073400 [Ceratopteris richardii]
MALSLANGSKRRLLCAAWSCRAPLEANLRGDGQGGLFLLCSELQQCSLYSRPRGPLWRGRKGIGKEALHAIGEVKRVKDDKIQLGNALHTKVARLLKADILAVLQELQRQQEVDLSLKIFNIIRKESWYKPDIYLYKDMLSCLAKAKRVSECETLLKDLKAEGLPPDGLILTEVMTAYLECRMLPQAMETFEQMRRGSVPPDLPAFRILLLHLKKMGNTKLRRKIRSECLEFYEGIVDSKSRTPKQESDDESEMEEGWSLERKHANQVDTCVDTSTSIHNNNEQKGIEGYQCSGDEEADQKDDPSDIQFSTEESDDEMQIRRYSTAEDK